MPVGEVVERARRGDHPVALGSSIAVISAMETAPVLGRTSVLVGTRGDRCEGAAMTLELTSSPPSAVRSFDDDDRLRRWHRPAVRRRRTAARSHRPGDHRPDRRRSVPRPCGGRRQLVGPRHRPARCAPRGHALLPHRPRHVDRLPSAVGPQVVLRPSAPQGRAGRLRFDGVRGWADQLGRQSPTAPRVLRHGRRPPFPAPPRRRSRVAS